jgi:hypothetical protein
MKLDGFIVHFKHSYHFQPVSCAIWFKQRADIHSAFEDKVFCFTHQAGILLKCLSIRRSQERIWTDLQFYSNIGPLDKKTPLYKIWFEPSIVHCPCRHRVGPHADPHETMPTFGLRVSSLLSRMTALTPKRSWNSNSRSSEDSRKGEGASNDLEVEVLRNLTPIQPTSIQISSKWLPFLPLWYIWSDDGWILPCYLPS